MTRQVQTFRDSAGAARAVQGTGLDWAAARPPAQRSATPRPAGPAPLPELAPLGLPELRALRRASQRDEADLSYVRRMLHGRIDILDAELTGRARDGKRGVGAAALPLVPPPALPPGHADPAGPTGPTDPAGPADPAGFVVGRLAAILLDEPTTHRSSARHLTFGTPLGEESRRLAETMLEDVGLSDLAARTDQELRLAMGRLVRYEAHVSRRRQTLQRTADGCSTEIARRYREGEAQVDDLLS